MRILVVHNRYRAINPSGENRVVELEIEALQSAGHDVSTYVRSSDELDGLSRQAKLRLITAPISSPAAVAEVENILLTRRPQVLHLHNPYPLISLSVVAAAHRHGVPVVQTVHNHRHTCMKGTYQREGHDCRDCLNAGNPLPGVRHACYRDSRAQSVVMAAALTRHRHTLDTVDRFIALTPEIRDSLVASGFDSARIVVKPNSVPDPGRPAPLGQGAAFVGRLSQEKGILALLQAWLQHPEWSLGPLRIAGDGPAREEVERLAAGRDDVRVLGRLEAADVWGLLRDSALVVVPSLWPEALPLVVLEAMAAGRALLVTNQGGLPAVVDASLGLVVEPSVQDLAAGLSSLLLDRSALEGLAIGAREAYERNYTPGVVTRRLVDIYESVITRQRL